MNAAGGRIATSVWPPSGDEASFLPAFANVIGYHLRIAQEASFQAVRQAAGRSELKPGWYTILTVLSDNAGLTPTELSRLCGRDRSTLTSTLSKLDARGLIARQHKVGDQRSYCVKLTRAGAQMLQRLRAIARAHDARLDAIVGNDKALLISLLRRIAEELGPIDSTTKKRGRSSRRTVAGSASGKAVRARSGSAGRAPAKRIGK